MSPTCLTYLSFLHVSLILSSAVNFWSPSVPSFPLFLHLFHALSFSVMNAVTILLLRWPLTKMIKPSFYTFTESVSLFTVRRSAHRSSLCGRGSVKPRTISSFTFLGWCSINTTHPAVIFLLLVIRTFIISHTSRCVWCSPPSQTSKSFIPSLMSIRKDWSASVFSTRS